MKMERSLTDQVLPQAKDALAKLKSMYERNILDQNFLLRTSVNNIELITKGLCGSFFGPWWAANNPLMEAIAANPDAVWGAISYSDR